MLNKPKSSISEAFRMLRTNLRFTRVDKEVKTILFTSANQDEGKTSTVACLAITMAQEGKRILLIDCDFRNPSIHKFFEISNANGLTTSLVTDASYTESIQRMKNTKFDVLTAGPIPPNPSELLGSSKMKEILDSASRSYDTILIDAPPVIPVTDASVLGQIVDGVVIIASSGELKKDMAVNTKEQLEKVGANILGVVLNKVKYHSKEQYYYYSNDN